jgi:Ni,Fe-hydrogenase I large subunit
VESGQLSVFANGYWGHPAYRLPPEVNLLAVSHYLDALEFQRDYIRIHAALGGKNPHPQTFLVGGMSTAMDPDSPQAPINPERLQLLRTLIDMGRQFVRQVYVPDVLAVAGFYPDWFTRGEGVGNFMSYGDYPDKSMRDPSTFFFPGGVVRKRDLSAAQPFSPEKVTEHVARSWYAYEDNKPAKHPFEGETKPTYTGPAPPYDYLHVDQKYSWLKAPRYENEVMELGPLARFLVAYAAGKQPAKGLVDSVLAQIKQPATVLFSTLGRIAARALEAQLMADKLTDWWQELEDNIGRRVLCHAQRRALGSGLVAALVPRFRAARSAARIIGPLGRDRGWRHPQLPGDRAHHLEWGSARCHGATRSVRGRADQASDCGPGQTARAASHHSLFRPVPGLRGPSRGCAGTPLAAG